MKKVAILRNNVLPISETFIKEQVLSLHRWQGKLFGAVLEKNGLLLNGLPYIIYRNNNTSWLSNQFRRVRELCNLAERNLVRALQDYNPALIHVHFGTDGVRSWPSLQKFEVPVVVTLHGFDITTYKKHWRNSKGPIARFYPERLLKMAQNPRVHFVAVSEAIRQSAVEFGIPSQKLTVQYIGIDSERFQAGPVPIEKRNKRILFVGRLTEKKGVMYLLRAYKNIHKLVPDTELVVVGDGADYRKASSFCQKNNLPVKFLGAISHAQVKKEMDQARVFCLPSVRASTGDREGFGMVILEAQACGVPVVSSAYGGATEGIREGETGFSFPEGDVAKLSKKLLLLLSDDEQLKKMSKAGPAFVKEKFDIIKCTRGLESYYDSLI